MGLGLYDPERRYRRRVWGTIIRVFFSITVLLVAAGFAYQIGVERTKGQITTLQGQVTSLTQAKGGLEQERIQLQAAAQTAQIQYRELTARFEREVPTGTYRELADKVAQRLHDGLDPQRLAFYIDQASAARDCKTGESKRFILPTQNAVGSNSSVAFANNTIAVTGRGEGTVDESGKAQAAYDPAKPITVNFRGIDGKQVSATGMLPLFQSLVVGEKEYRFSLIEGERSFVRVTSEVCAFP
jgi:hypothetical protein